ncbi:hypothetical protein GQX74_015057 [Glossina fuscipes]|nr:hypothetical protein GQX74_015057 [Glossina fuscipes]
MISKFECYTKRLVIGSLSLSVNLCVEAFKFFLVMVLTYGIGQFLFVYLERHFPSLCECPHRTPKDTSKKTPIPDFTLQTGKVWKQSQITKDTESEEEMKSLWEADNTQSEHPYADSSTDPMYNEDEEWRGPTAQSTNASSADSDESEGPTRPSKKYQKQYSPTDAIKQKVVKKKMEKATQTSGSWKKALDKNVDAKRSYKESVVKEMLPNYLKSIGVKNGFDVSVSKPTKKTREARQHGTSPVTKKNLVEKFESREKKGSDLLKTSKKIRGDKTSSMLLIPPRKFWDETGFDDKDRRVSQPNQERRPTQDYLRAIPIVQKKLVNTSESPSYQTPRKRRSVRREEEDEFHPDEVVISKSTFVPPDFVAPKTAAKGVDEYGTTGKRGYLRKSAQARLERHPNGNDLKVTQKKREISSETWSPSVQSPSHLVSPTSKMTHDKAPQSRKKHENEFDEMDKTTAKPKYPRKSAEARLETHPSEDDLKGMLKLRPIASDAWDQYLKSPTHPAPQTPFKAHEEKVSTQRKKDEDELSETNRSIPKPKYARKSAEPRLETHLNDENLKGISKRRVASDTWDAPTQSPKRPVAQKSPEEKAHLTSAQPSKPRQLRQSAEARLETHPSEDDLKGMLKLRHIASDAWDQHTKSPIHPVPQTPFKAHEEKVSTQRQKYEDGLGETNKSIPKPKYARKSAESRLETHPNEENLKGTPKRRVASDTWDAPIQSPKRPVTQKTPEETARLIRAQPPKPRHPRQSAEARLETHPSEDNNIRLAKAGRFASDTWHAPPQSPTRPLPKTTHDNKAPVTRQNDSDEHYLNKDNHSVSTPHYPKEEEKTQSERRPTQVELMGTPRKRRFLSDAWDQTSQPATRRKTD